MTIPLPVIAGTFRCAINWVEPGGQTATNVIHIAASFGTATAANAFAALGAAQHPNPNMFEAQSAGAESAGVQITPLDGHSATSTFTFNSGDWTGAGVNTPWDPAVSNLIKITTSRRGRQYRGRIYLPFVDRSLLTDGQFTSTSLATTIGNAWTAFNNALLGLTSGSMYAGVSAGGAWSLGVASYDRAHSGAGATYTPLLSVIAERIMATQRRRQGRLRSA